MPSKKPIDTEALSEIMRVTSIPTQHPTVFWDGIPAAHEGFTFQVVSAYLLKMGHPTETAYHLAGNTGGSVRVRLASCLKQLANI